MVDGEYWVMVWIKLLLWICKIYFRGIWCIDAMYTHIFRMILNVKNKTKNGFGIFMLPVAFRSLG